MHDWFTEVKLVRLDNDVLAQNWNSMLVVGILFTYWAVMIYRPNSISFNCILIQSEWIILFLKDTIILSQCLWDMSVLVLDLQCLWDMSVLVLGISFRIYNSHALKWEFLIVCIDRFSHQTTTIYYTFWTFHLLRNLSPNSWPYFILIFDINHVSIRWNNPTKNFCLRKFIKIFLFQYVKRVRFWIYWNCRCTTPKMIMICRRKTVKYIFLFASSISILYIYGMF